MKDHPDAMLMIRYLQTMIRIADKGSTLEAKALKYASENVDAHVKGHANMKDVFEEVIRRYSQPAAVQSEP